MADETSMGGTGSRFQSTLWETVLQAKQGTQEAIDRLVADYWKPVYFFVRRKGYDIESAKDLTQGFLGIFLEKDYLGRVSPDLGRFRSFVMACLENYLAKDRDRSKALKRGGGFNFVQAESDLTCTDASPEKAFFRAWALTILERAMARVAAEVPAEDIALLSGSVPPGMSASERKNRLHRLRMRIRKQLREEVLPGSESEAEVDSEVRAIFSVLG